MQRQVDERMKHQHTKKCAFTFIYRIYQIWHCQACPHVDIHDRYLVPNKVHRKSHLLCSLTWMKHDGVLSLRNFLTCLHQRKGLQIFFVLRSEHIRGPTKLLFFWPCADHKASLFGVQVPSLVAFIGKLFSSLNSQFRSIPYGSAKERKETKVTEAKN